MIEQPQHHVDAVADPDEVAKLPAVGVIRVVRLEQLRRLALAELAAQVPGAARLAALVVLVGAIDVEELEARPLRRYPRPIRGRLLGDPPRHPAAGDVLAPAVAVQRAPPREVLALRSVVDASPPT